MREEYAVSNDGMKVFGVLVLETTFDECRFAIGIRNSNDKSMRLATFHSLFSSFSGKFSDLCQQTHLDLSQQSVLPAMYACEGTTDSHRDLGPG